MELLEVSRTRLVSVHHVRGVTVNEAPLVALGTAQLPEVGD
jgi:hypothetical protein